MTTFRSESTRGRRHVAVAALAALAALACLGLAPVAWADATALAPGSAATIPVPSGQVVTLHDVVLDAPGPEGPVPRYRFLMPGVARAGGTVGFGQAAGDLEHLCDAVVLPDLARSGPLPGAVILSASDRAVVFGETDPEATQFFTAFEVVDGRCILEPF